MVAVNELVVAATVVQKQVWCGSVCGSRNGCGGGDVWCQGTGVGVGVVWGVKVQGVVVGVVCVYGSL